MLLAAALALQGCAPEAADVAGSESSVTSSDRRDPALAKGDRVAGESTVWGRRVVLHLSDPDGAAWGSIEAGDPGDRVWIDRSFNGGIDWEGKLGETSIPKGARGWRTMMYELDQPEHQRLGAVRACGKAGNRAEITCTSWFRTQPEHHDRLDEAALALMQQYDAKKGLFREIGWWNSANALTTVIEYQIATGSKAYERAIGTTFDENRGDDFTNDYMDDTAWWGLAWIRAYDATKDVRYLDMAKRDADYLWSFRDDVCGGGVWWRVQRDYKNAITNELFVKLAAEIHNRVPGDTTYLQRAENIWNWFEASGMINAKNLVNDGLDGATCKNNGQTTWTYNQGVILGGLVALYKATGNAKFLTKGRALADASTSDSFLNPGGKLREPCESNADRCGVDGPSFKGIYVRNLAELDRALPGRPYRSYLRRLADNLFAERTTLAQYGVTWGAPIDHVDAARQHSAVDLFIAADR